MRCADGLWRRSARMTILTVAADVATSRIGKGFVKDVKWGFPADFSGFSHATLRLMMRVPRFGGTTWLAVTVALLLPALAWLQYDWANQLATASRERRERTLRAAGAQFTAAVNTEISRLGASLQLDGAMVERKDWDAYALRYDSVLDDGAGVLVAGVWFVEVDEPPPRPTARLRLHVWRDAQSARSSRPSGQTPCRACVRSSSPNRRAAARRAGGRIEPARDVRGGQRPGRRAHARDADRACAAAARLGPAARPLQDRRRRCAASRSWAWTSTCWRGNACRRSPPNTSRNPPSIAWPSTSRAARRVLFESTPGAATDTAMRRTSAPRSCSRASAR